MSAPTGAGRASSRLDPRWLWLPLGLLLAVAFAVSYSHGVAVFTARGQGGWVARVLAGTPELMAVTALLALAAGVLTGWARLVLVVSVGATVVLNVAAAAPQWDHQLAALWPAVAFLLPLPLAHGRTGPAADTGRPDTAVLDDAAPGGVRPAAEPEVTVPEAPAQAAATPPVVQPVPLRLAAPRRVKHVTGRVASSGAGRAGEVMALLDQLGVPSDAGRDRCRHALTTAGITAGTGALATAVRARKTAASSQPVQPAAPGASRREPAASSAPGGPVLVAVPALDELGNITEPADVTGAGEVDDAGDSAPPAAGGGSR